jgi:hypothetical protein
MLSLVIFWRVVDAARENVGVSSGFWCIFARAWDGVMQIGC